MKPAHWFALPVLLLGLLLPSPVHAQTVLPPAASSSASQITITGKVVNQNEPEKAAQDLDVMLHIFDAATQNSVNMLHAKTGLGGAFEFQNVPLQEDFGYAVMAVYDGATYVSDPQYAQGGKNSFVFDVAVYETTKDPSNAQIDQIHVLLNFAQDGMEVKEVYLVSNLGDRTLKDAQTLPDGKSATLKFGLPKEASFVFFQPEDPQRFVQYPGGFADTAPLVPGTRTGQFMVSYLLPYADPLGYAYLAALPTRQVNLVLSEDSGVTLSGAGLGAPQTQSMRTGQKVVVYASEPLKAGESLKVTINGKPKFSTTSASASSSAQAGPLTPPVYIAGGLLGVALIGSGIWWWRRSQPEAEEVDSPGVAAPSLDELINQIARLDQSHQDGGVPDEEYQSLREDLMKRARAQMGQGEEPGQVADEEAG